LRILLLSMVDHRGRHRGIDRDFPHPVAVRSVVLLENALNLVLQRAPGLLHEGDDGQMPKGGPPASLDSQTKATKMCTILLNSALPGSTTLG